MAGSSAAGPGKGSDNGHHAVAVCPSPRTAAAACQSEVIADAAGVPLAGGSPPAGAFGPSDLSAAYDLPGSAPAGMTLGIVDAYDDPAIESDLAVYDTQYGLPACTTANGCLRKVDEHGGTSYPGSNAGWALETSLDVEVAHGLCPTCRILLVEATSPSLTDLGTSENTAASLGADAISNSWAAGEYRSETSDETAYFNHPGVPTTVATADNGYGVTFPAASHYVTAVGGTTLTLGAGGGYGSETVWNGTGSGCSHYVAKPTWQHDTGCTRRTVGDVAADANPNTGVGVYDSIPTGGASGWFQVGGTSLATPIIAVAYLLAGTPGQISNASVLYGHTAALHDITSGSNGSCGSYLCQGHAGYDGPTGVGTPNGVSAFAVGGAQPPPSPDFGLAATPASGTVTQGGSTTYTVSVSGSGGFAGTVALSASGLPAGATAGFSPASTGSGGSSTLTISTTGAVATGSYTVTVKGTSGALSHTTSVTLVVQSAAVPGFGLSAVPTTRTVTAGTGAAYTISTSGSGGFTGSVSLSASGLPTGASASFSPTSVAAGSSSTLTVATSTAVAAGSYTLTVTGSGSPGSHSLTVVLVVASSGGGGGGGGGTADFAISVNPATATVPSTGTSTFTVSIQPTGGFAGAVSLSVGSLPRNMSVSFSPNPTTSTSTLTLTTTSVSSHGAISITITGTSGSLSHSTVLKVTSS